MTERWAYCSACRRWFFCAPPSAKPDGSFVCPVCMRPSTHTREGGPGNGAEPEDLVAESTDG